MIDVIHVKKQFETYVSQYNPEDGRIKLKIDHILRVASISKFIAKELQLTQEQCELAEVIGFFHDIGRFKQAQKYHTFSDKESGLDHAAYSLKILYEDNLIETFNINEIYHTLIKSAVFNHNKPVINPDLSEEQTLFAKILRDADKLDIFYTICTDDFENIFWYPDFTCEKINDYILSDFFTNQKVDYQKIKTNADQIVCFYAYVYDLYFPITRKKLNENQYLEIFTNRVIEHFKSPDIQTQVQQILKKAKQALLKKGE